MNKPKNKKRERSKPATKQYRLISASYGSASADVLTNKLNKLLQAGWQLHGSPFSDQTSIYQAVVKKGWQKLSTT